MTEMTATRALTWTEASYKQRAAAGKVDWRVSRHIRINWAALVVNWPNSHSSHFDTKNEAEPADCRVQTDRENCPIITIWRNRWRWSCRSSI